MAEIATVARPYAEALFQVAQSGNLGQWSELVDELVQVASLPEVQSIADSPKLNTNQVTEMVLSLLKSSILPGLKNFVEAVVENGKFKAIPEIGHQFALLRHTAEGWAQAEIVSAFPLEGSALDDLLVALERKFARRLKAHVTVDQSLIGGVKVTVGDEVLDSSVKARLAQMQVALTA